MTDSVGGSERFIEDPLLQNYADVSIIPRVYLVTLYQVSNYNLTVTSKLVRYDDLFFYTV